MNKIICIDSIKFMKDLPDKSIDLILTDPPYGINLEYDNYKDTEDNWYDLMKQFLPEAIRVSHMCIFPAGNRYALPWFYQNFPPLWLIIWYKGSTGHRSPIGFNDWEPLLVYGKRKGVIMHDYMKEPCKEKMGNYGHPCPKPEGWAEWIITRVARKDKITVYDPFCGSGTVCVVAKRLRHNFIGTDISQKYCNIAKERLTT